ncbi:hypothetical protein [Breoghania sp. JC706]|uniref:Ppx/GppA phosphatase family protein n=1 Tax=Breoghania sp. JC706 TaxID=3117732 RepID=UPI00300963DE
MHGASTVQTPTVADTCSPGGERRQKKRRRRKRCRDGEGAHGAARPSHAGKDATPANGKRAVPAGREQSPRADDGNECVVERARQAGSDEGGGETTGRAAYTVRRGSRSANVAKAAIRSAGPGAERRSAPAESRSASGKGVHVGPRREEHPRRAPPPSDRHSVPGRASGAVAALPGEARGARAERDPRAGDYRGTLYAALDLGTNNCRLLVAKPEGRSFRVVDAYSRIVRLGEGIGYSHRLSDAAMVRAIEALSVCRDKLALCGSPVRMRLIATEACRAAENGPLFIERVRAETGLALEIVTRETEARLAVAGCTSLVAPDADGVVLFDIGGGSSELVWLDLRNRCGARGLALTRFIRHWTSLPLGVVTLAERHGGTKVGPESFEAMVEDVSEHLTSFAMGAMLSDAISSGDVHMLGTSGTVTTLAGVHLGLERYDRRRVDGTWLADTDVSAMIERLLAMPYEERVDNPCIGADRADLVLAGCAILEAIRRRWPCKRLRVADRGLREGILMELMAADRKGRKPGRPRH